MMSFTNLFLIISIGVATLAGGSPAAAAIRCQGIFATAENSLQLKSSVEDSILALAQMRLDLDRDQVQGVRNITTSVLATNYATKENELFTHFEEHRIMTREEAMEKLRQAIAGLQSQKKAIKVDNKEQKITKSLRSIKKVYTPQERAEFHKIETGSMRIDYLARYNLDTKVTVKNFEMMSRLTTVFFWDKIISLGKKRYKSTFFTNRWSAKGNINRPAELVQQEKDNDLIPITYHDYETILAWFKLLNDLSKHGEPALAGLIVDHKQGDLYRLPTENEWEFVISNRGQNYDRLPFGESSKDLDDYAWHSGNSGRKLHPVGEKTPFIVDGKPFYDLLGNVDEWVTAYYHYSVKIGIRGGNYTQSLDHIRSSVLRAERDPTTLRDDAGFRMVRKARR